MNGGGRKEEEETMLSLSLSLSLFSFLGKRAADTEKNPTQILNAEEDKR